MSQKNSLIFPFFLLTYAITWGTAAFAILTPDQFQALFGKLTDTNPMYFFAVAAPTITATLFAFLQDGLPGLKALYARLVQWRFGLQWYLLVLAGMPALGWFATLIFGSNPLKEINSQAEFLRLLVYLMVTGPLCEELGWRGFALPRLLKGFTPLAASLILGILWGIWHLPSFFLSGMVQDGMSLPFFLLFTIGMSIVMTWIWQHTAGSVLITVLLHFTTNFCGTILGATLPIMGIGMLVGAGFVVVLDKNFGWPHPLIFNRPIYKIGEL